MTSKFKCPVCHNNMHKINAIVSTCTNDKCKLWGLPIPNLVLEVLTQAKQDLEITTKALKDIASGQIIEHSVFGHECDNKIAIARKALELIEHKE